MLANITNHLRRRTTMKRTLTSIAMATLFASICLLASTMTMAQTEQATESIKEAESAESTTCPPAQTFTFGSGASKFAFCITDHGNIQNLEFPATFKHITTREGYAVSSVHDILTHGFDTGTVESGWGPASATQPGGPHTFPLTIIRSSTDGKVQLKQTFEWDTTRKDIIITMVVKNISAAALSGVLLSRYFDGDVDNDGGDDRYDDDADSIWARENFTGHGLRLTALSFATTHNTFAEDYGEWNPNGSGSQTARHCFVNMSSSVQTLPGDFVGRLTYQLGTINAGQTKTVKVLYSRF
jgi:hypothetical protein